MTIKDKVIIVTGASAGIGRSTAKLLGQKDARPALVARLGRSGRLFRSSLYARLLFSVR